MISRVAEALYTAMLVVIADRKLVAGSRAILALGELVIAWHFGHPDNIIGSTVCFDMTSKNNNASSNLSIASVACDDRKRASLIFTVDSPYLHGFLASRAVLLAMDSCNAATMRDGGGGERLRAERALAHPATSLTTQTR